MEQFKPLLTLGGKTLVERVISLFLDNEIEVILVTGFRQEELIEKSQNNRILIAENPHYSEGMFTSIKAGIMKLDPEHRAFFIMPVDIPLVRPFTIHRITNAAIENPADIIYPTFDNQRGHPPLIPANLIPAILDWNKPGGMKSFLESQNELTLEVSVPDRYILRDIDTPREFNEISEAFRNYEIPTDEECRIILDEVYQVPQEIRQHCRKVAQVAQAIGQALTQAGQVLNLELIRSAAMLHDIAKTSPLHDQAGRQMLHEMGFGKTGDIVALHTDLQPNLTEGSAEAKVVYLADKFVRGEHLVTLEERFQAAHDLYGMSSEVASKINLRRQQASAVKLELENLLGYPLEQTLSGLVRI